MLLSLLKTFRDLDDIWDVAQPDKEAFCNLIVSFLLLNTAMCFLFQ